MPEKNENLEIDLKRVLFALLKHLWLIILAGILAGSMTFCYAYFAITPKYSASAKLFVNNNYVDSPGFTSSQLVAAQNLAHTYMVILESHNVIDEVAETTDLGYSYAQLCSMISARSVNETEVFQVTVTCEDYKHAAIIANAVADILPEKIHSIVDGSSVRILDRAIESNRRVSPIYENYAMIGAAVGMAVVSLIVILVDLMDRTIKSRDYLAKTYPDIPLLVAIPSGEYPKYTNQRGYYESVGKRKPTQNTGGGQQ